MRSSSAAPAGGSIPAPTAWVSGEPAPPNRHQPPPGARSASKPEAWITRLLVMAESAASVRCASARSALEKGNVISFHPRFLVELAGKRGNGGAPHAHGHHAPERG